MKNKQLTSILILFLIILTSCNPYKYPLAPNLKNIEYNVKDFDSITGYLNEYRKAFDVKFYDLDLAIYPSKKTIEGSVDITFKIVNATNKIQIELASNFDVSSITESKSKSLNFNRKGKVILIDFDKTYQIGETETIKVNYSGKPQVAKKPPWRGGFVWDSNKGKPYIGVACEDDGASIWWPLKDHISDKPDSVRLSFTIPKGLFCVSNGQLVDRQTIGDNQEKFIWKTSYPINTYNVSFYIGDYKHFQIPYTNKTGEHLLDFYVLPKHLEVAKEHFKQSLDVIKVFEELFGEYPWWKDGYKLVESPYQGMEHQSAIAYGDKFKNGILSSADYIIVHETAHEWWGNKITVCDMADLWLHEGFATYSEALYAEKMNLEYDYDFQIGLNIISCKNKLPVVGPKDVSYTNWKDGDIYSKGSITLHLLRITINNDPIFFTILYKFVTDYADNCVTSQDFINLVNKVTKNDYTWLFEQLLYKAEAPTLLYQIKYISSNNYDLLYKWEDSTTIKNFKLPVHLLTDNISTTIYPTHKIQVKKIDDWIHTQLIFDLEQFVVLKKTKF